MNQEAEMQCLHQCRNTCAMLSRALHEETMMVRLYEEIFKDCDDPDIRAFVRTLTEERSAAVLRIMQKLNEIKARSQVLDGVIASFNSQRTAG